MIRYALKCSEGHEFDSWFRNSEAFESLAAAGQIGCAICGSTKVEKMIMAPAVPAKKTNQVVEAAPLSAPAHPAEAALKKLRAHLRENSDYVGKEFASEARKIHEGEAEERGIWGEATVEDAKSLAEDGIPVAPIPWMSRTND